MSPTKKQYKYPGGYLAFPRQVVRSPAYKNLKPNARSLMIELQDVWRSNDPIIHFDVRRAAKLLNISTGSVSIAFNQLKEHGFIRCASESNWVNGMAREWLLTWTPNNGREPLNDFFTWKKK